MEVCVVRQYSCRSPSFAAVDVEGVGVDIVVATMVVVCKRKKDEDEEVGCCVCCDLKLYLSKWHK